jgi:diamine N-acetyltransferase
VAFVDDDLVFGFSMWALDENDGSHWIGGFQIDRHHQRQGFGRDALQALLAWLKEEQGAERVALAYDEHNEVARSLYRSEGFVETGEIEDGELVARRSLS